MSIIRTLVAEEPERAQPVGQQGTVFPGYTLPGNVGSPSPVSEITALRYPAVYAAVRVLAESSAQLPLLTYLRQGDGDRARVQDSADPRAKMLRLAPNGEMTAFELWEASVGCLNLLGNMFLFKQRDAYGRVSGLWPLPPQVTQTLRDEQGTLWYYVTPGPMFGPATLEPSLYRSDEVMHLRGFSLDGRWGLSPISLHRRAINIGGSADDYAEAFYLNNATPNGALTTEKQLSPDQFTKLQAAWEAGHQGVGNAHRVAVLEGGVSWQALALPNADAQFLESRQYQVTDIARIFRVPPHMIGDLSRATFSNIEQQSIDFVTYSLQPWLTRIEQRVTGEVFDASMDEGMFGEFLVDGLLRGDTATRYGAYVQAPWMTDNEKRRKENLPALEGLDEPTRPLNVSTVAAAESDTQGRINLAVAMVKAGAQPAAALAAVGLTELSDSIAQLQLTAAPPAQSQEAT